MINEEKVRELFNIALCDSKSDDSRVQKLSLIHISDSLENVFELTEGNAIVDIVDGEQMTFSQNFACPDRGISIDEVEPRSFSFNNPFGACPTCYGLGYKMEFDPQLMVPDASLSISEAVSYTHLDVYKRQQQSGSGKYTVCSE